jgi:hypothetical protein
MNILAVMIAFALFPQAIFATCARCEAIRDEREKNPEPQYEYYDEYLKAKESGTLNIEEKTK